MANKTAEIDVDTLFLGLQKFRFKMQSLMNNQGTVLIIDDEKKLSSLLSRIIGLEGYEVLQASSAKEGLKLLGQKEVDVVISDVKLPDVNGIELIKLLKQKKADVEIINLTAFGSIADGVQAIKNGAFDYITKGDDNEKILPLLARAMEKVNHRKQLDLLGDQIKKNKGLDDITGKSPAIKTAVNLARKVAAQDTTVLLLGETGTGKEVFARAIHHESHRKNATFVAVNCSSFTADLLESELFGYKEGAFTGATRDKKGLLEEADGGTIFLDEVGEMNLALQARLLRFLEDQTFIKVGDTQTTRVNARIIAATNRDLSSEVEKGHFREDLFYRLSVFAIALPSLAERGTDIPLLAERYLKEFTLKTNKPHLSMPPDFINALLSHSWKGNIRELKNIMERVVILAESSEVTVDLLPPEFHETAQGEPAFDMQTVEKQHIQKVLNYTRGNKTESARLLGIGLTTLYRKIAEYNL